MPITMRSTLAVFFLLSAFFCANAKAETCSVSTTPMAFSIYSPLLGTPTDSVATITVTCSAVIALGVSYTIKMDAGLKNSFSPRYMANGAALLSYQLYIDAARTTAWGDGSAGTSYVTDGYLLGILAPVIRPYFVYGRIPALQNVAAGTYNDTVTVLLTY